MDWKKGGIDLKWTDRRRTQAHNLFFFSVAFGNGVNGIPTTKELMAF